MGYHRVTQLEAYQYDLEGGTTYHRRRRQHLFTRTELALLIPLTTLGTGLGVFTVVYIVSQRNTIQPAAIAALGGTSLLLIAVLIFVFRRLRRPAWSSGVEPQAEKSTWQASRATVPPTTAVPVPYHRMVPESTEPRELLAAVPITKPPSPAPSTFGSRLRHAIEKSVSADILPRGSFDGQSSSAGHEDRELLLHSDSGRSSIESSEAGRGHGLWHSIFELPADGKLEKLRQKNLKRLSKESRRSRQDMTGFDRPVSRGDNPPVVQIVVTRPQATASRSGDSRRSSAAPSFDPLRANPVHLKRDPSMRQTRSTQDLTRLGKGNTTIPAVRRPRSAEPGPDRCGLGHEPADRASPREAPVAARPKPVSPPRAEQEPWPARRGTPDTVKSMPVSPLTPKQVLKNHYALSEVTTTVGVSPVSPLSFAERMAQREKGRRRAESPSAGVARDARDLRAVYMNRV